MIFRTPLHSFGTYETGTVSQYARTAKRSLYKVAPNPDGLQIMHDKDTKRMVNFRDIPDEQIESIKAPTLIILGDQDIIKPGHALEMHRQIANSELAIIPGVHGEYIGK